MGNPNKCKDELISKLAKQLQGKEDKEIKELVDTMWRAHEEGKALQDIYDDLVMEIKLMTMDENRAKLFHTVKYFGAIEKIKKFADSHEDRDLVEGYRALLVGTNRPVEGMGQNIGARALAFRNEYFGGYINDLEKSGLFETFKKADKDFELNIVKELEVIDDAGKSTNITGDKTAGKIAEVINKWQGRIVDDQNANGAFINKIAGYITKHTHDPDKVRGVLKGKDIKEKTASYSKAREDWKNLILDSLDKEKSFSRHLSDEDIDGILDDSFWNIVTGERLKMNADGTFSTKLSTKSLAKRVGAHRVFHFKSGEAWFKYNQKYGKGNLFATTKNMLEMGAQNVAAMETLGPNPKKMHEDIMAFISSEAKKNDDLIVMKKQKEGLRRRYTDALYKEVTGESHIVEDKRISSIASGIRKIENMSKLGSAVISAVADMPLMSREMSRQGVDFITRWSVILDNLFNIANSDKERAELARMIGVGMEGMHADYMNRFVAVDGGVGMISKAHETFFKVSGLQQWTDAHKVGVGMFMSNYYANMAGKQFDDLDVLVQNMFKKYGIDADAWDKIRSAELYEFKGNKYLVSDNIAKVDAALAIDWKTMLLDRVDYAVITPGAKQRALMNMGYRPGTLEGEAIRFLMQFKSFSITVLQKTYGDIIYGNQLGGRGAMGMMKGMGQNLLPLMATAANMTAMGYISMSMKDLLKGKKPKGWIDIREGRVPENYGKIFLASLAQGGALGILGDIVLSAEPRYGHSALGAVMGPAFNTIAQITNIATKAIRGKNFQSDLLWLARGSTPFANLYYARWAVDYLFTYTMQEFVNPGYTRRVNKRLKKNDRTEFLLK